MKKAVVLGCGMVGATLARDLAADPDFTVTAVDVSDPNLARLGGVPRLRTQHADLSSTAALKSLIAEHDVICGALPSALGFGALRTVAESGKPYCDISFMAEDALAMNDVAKNPGTVAVVDCGVAPGLANLLIGVAAHEYERLTNVAYYVGGLPAERHWPYQYRAPFAPLDVLEEYTRPARLIEHGRLVTRPALSEVELLDFPRVGTLEAFNTDGLRSLLTTIQADNMREKTLRYPGHAELMRVLRETGYFSKDPVDIRGASIRPIDLTAKLLFPLWRRLEHEREFTILRVVVEGIRRGRPWRTTHDLYDETDAESGQTSMARTTAFPAAIVARLLAERAFHEPGIHPPESLGRRPELVRRILTELGKRNVNIATQEGPVPEDAS